MKIKDGIYDFLVRNNPNVQKEYEKYVQEHIAEHYENRFRHWKILWSLNWHYRVKKKQEPLLYFEPCRNPAVSAGKTKGKAPIGKAPVEKAPVGNAKAEKSHTEGGKRYPESSRYFREEAEKFAEKLLEYDVISFDMFDTLVFRVFDNPKDVFWLVGNALHIPNYKVIRTAVEEECRKAEKTNEITIEEIYETIAERFSVEKQKAIKTELEYENRVCFANPYMYTVYKKLIAHGKKVIVTSNMYLRREQLWQILNRCGYDKIDEIYVSCEYRASKKNGALQKLVNDSLEKGTSVIHIGDNYYMDVEGARIAGWKAIHYKNVNQAGKEYRPAQMAELSGSMYKGLVNAKLHCGIPLNPYYEYGYAYAGFLVYGFCKWLNDLGKCKEIDKFLFAARDMDVVSKAYVQYFGQIDSEYIKASRTSSIHLSFERHTQHFIDWHVKRRISSAICMEQVLSELGIADLTEKLSSYELQPEEILTKENCDKLKQLIFDNKKQIADSYEIEKKAAEKYYREKIGGAKRICIVDLGWKGSTANSLEYFFKEGCGMETEVFCALLGMEGHAFVDELMSAGKIFSYMFSGQDNTDLMKIHNLNGNIWRRIYEIIFTSEEQSLLNFTLREDGTADFAYLRNEKRNPEIVSNIQAGILDFIRDYSKAEKRIGVSLQIAAREAYQPFSGILKEKEYNLSLFEDFEVCFIAGDVKENNIELFKDVVMHGGK